LRKGFLFFSPDEFRGAAAADGRLLAPAVAGAGQVDEHVGGRRVAPRVWPVAGLERGGHLLAAAVPGGVRPQRRGGQIRRLLAHRG